MKHFFAFFMILIATSAAGQNYISGQPCYLSGNVTKCFKPINAASGGTGLASGTSGGIPYFNTTTSMLSSGLLTANGVVLGGGAGATPTSTAAGTNGQLLVGVTSGAPAWGNSISAATTFSSFLTVSETTGGTGNVVHGCTRRSNTCNNPATSCTLSCSSGERVMGGGCEFTGSVGAGSITENYPSNNGAWVCTYSVAPSTAVVSYGICCVY